MPLVDVLRAAVAEVEDYTRIKVNATTRAALAGPAVGDVIHMIAELAENAAIFSPPNTPVLIGGDMVGRGFAVEIEDRGLGLTDEQLAEINDRLENPPPFDLSGSDQLGLFVAGQLARRHQVQDLAAPLPLRRDDRDRAHTAQPDRPGRDLRAGLRSRTARSAAAIQLTGRHAARAGDPAEAAMAGVERGRGRLTPARLRRAPRAGCGGRPSRPARPATPPGSGWPGRPTEDPASTADLGELLPRRVRQASLAPQLRTSAPGASAAPGGQPRPATRCPVTARRSRPAPRSRPSSRAGSGAGWPLTPPSRTPPGSSGPVTRGIQGRPGAGRRLTAGGNVGGAQQARERRYQ